MHSRENIYFGIFWFFFIETNEYPLPIFRIHVQERVSRAERQFRILPERQQALIPNFLPNLAKIRQCIDQNQEVLKAIVRNCIHMFENMEYGEDVSFFVLE